MSLFSCCEAKSIGSHPLSLFRYFVYSQHLDVPHCWTSIHLPMAFSTVSMCRSKCSLLIYGTAAPHNSLPQVILCRHPANSFKPQQKQTILIYALLPPCSFIPLHNSNFNATSPPHQYSFSTSKLKTTPEKRGSISCALLKGSHPEVTHRGNGPVLPAWVFYSKSEPCQCHCWWDIYSLLAREYHKVNPCSHQAKLLG